MDGGRGGAPTATLGVRPDIGVLCLVIRWSTGRGATFSDIEVETTIMSVAEAGTKTMWLRLVLAAAGAIAATFVARDAPNFGVVQGFVGIAVIAAVVVVLALFPKR
jgi:hypothetical protein